MIFYKKYFLNMVFIFTILIYLFLGCSTLETKINSFVKDIIIYPEKLDSLKVYYPELINEKYLSKIMLDSNFLNKVKNKLIQYFQRENMCLKKQEIGSESLERFIKRNKINYDLKNIRGYTFRRGKVAIRIILYFETNQNFLIYLEDTTFPNS